MKVAVVGCGYVGLVTAAGLASVGHDVVGIETDAGRREAIAAGALPFHEPGLGELLQEQRAAGRFEIAGDSQPVPDADVIFVAVQTPPGDRGVIDLGFLEQALQEIAARLAAAPHRPRVVAVRSTVVPGTSAQVVRPAIDDQTWVAANPEFLREGTAVADFLHPDRVVVGCDDEGGYELLRELYEPFGAPIIHTSPATAELTKYASNAFLATLISFSNEIARISEDLPGVDADEVLAILHRDRRLSPVVDGEIVAPGILAFLKAGVGFGGSCLPKDLAALLASRAEQGLELPLLKAVLSVNDKQAERVVDLLEQRLGDLAGRSVAVLGAAFKGGTDDVRASPGLRVLDRLLERGVETVIFDPLVSASALGEYVARGVVVAAGLEEALEATEACIVTTNAAEFSALADAVRDPGYVVLDGRRALDPSAFDEYLAVGRGPRGAYTRDGGRFI